MNIQLTEDDYRGIEPEESIRIIISKDARIETNVSVTVTPVVLSEARRLNMFLMNVVPPDDNQGRSPVKASERIYYFCSSTCDHGSLKIVNIDE